MSISETNTPYLAIRPAKEPEFIPAWATAEEALSMPKTADVTAVSRITREKLPVPSPWPVMVAMLAAVIMP